MGCGMRKPAFCICENKGAIQLRCYGEADQCLCFCFIESTIPLLPKFEFSIDNLCGCTARFVSTWQETPKTGFLTRQLNVAPTVTEGTYYSLNKHEFIIVCSRVMYKTAFAYAKIKRQISCVVTPQLISAFVFNT